MAKLTEKSAQVLNYLQANDLGSGVPITEIADALGTTTRGVLPIVTLNFAAKKDGSRPALATYEKREVEGVEKPVGYAVLTDAGRNYVDAE